MTNLTPIEIDGAMGEGGGQVLRSSLSLAAVTGRAVHLRRIRANRAKPGLMRQHLTAVLAAARASNAELVGVPVGEHLADQLLLPMALAGGGAFRTLALSRHATTNIDVIRAFLDVPIAVEADDRHSATVRIG